MADFTRKMLQRKCAVNVAAFVLFYFWFAVSFSQSRNFWENPKIVLVHLKVLFHALYTLFSPQSTLSLDSATDHCPYLEEPAANSFITIKTKGPSPSVSLSGGGLCQGDIGDNAGWRFLWRNRPTQSWGRVLPQCPFISDTGHLVQWSKVKSVIIILI